MEGHRRPVPCLCVDGEDAEPACDRGCRRAGAGGGAEPAARRAEAAEPRPRQLGSWYDRAPRGESSRAGVAVRRAAAWHRSRSRSRSAGASTRLSACRTRRPGASWSGCAACATSPARAERSRRSSGARRRQAACARAAPAPPRPGGPPLSWTVRPPPRSRVRSSWPEALRRRRRHRLRHRLGPQGLRLLAGLHRLRRLASEVFAEKVCKVMDMA